jgi:hypothetical protein
VLNAESSFEEPVLALFSCGGLVKRLLPKVRRLAEIDFDHTLDGFIERSAKSGTVGVPI